MTNKLDLYKGREQSFVKHDFLTRYLQTAAYKTLQGRSKTFNFIDAFAGPWKVNDAKNYSDASFDQAINTLETVRADLGRQGISGLKIRMCCCEKRLSSFRELKNYANTNKRFDIHVYHGTFEEHLDDILKVCSDGFTFTFIDPTGWNIGSHKIFNFLKKLDGDFLLNFMAEDINRHAEYEKVSASFGRFLADPEWEKEYDKLSDELSNEEKILSILKSKIKLASAAKYTPHYEILKPLQERIKMRLVFGTNSPKGVKVFRDVQEKAENVENETRDVAQRGDSDQGNFFTPATLAKHKLQTDGIGSSLHKEKAIHKVLEILTTTECIDYAMLSTLIMEEIPIRLPDLNQVIIKMKSDCQIEFQLEKRKRVPQEATVIKLRIEP